MNSDGKHVEPCYVPPPDEQKEDPPPFLGSWPRVYSAVLAYLVVLLSVLSFISYAARY